jgi:hypothetical protein
MSLDTKSMKAHLLLLNRLHRIDFKKDLVPKPSKLTDTEIKENFIRLFVKKENYYVPKSRVSLMIEEEPFRKIKLKFNYTKEQIAENARLKAIADRPMIEERERLKKERAEMKKQERIKSKSEDKVRMETLQKELSNRLVMEKVNKLRSFVRTYELDKSNIRNKKAMEDEFIKMAKNKAFVEFIKRTKAYELYFKQPYEDYIKRKEKLRTEEEELKRQIKDESRRKKKPEIMG